MNIGTIQRSRCGEVCFIEVKTTGQSEHLGVGLPESMVQQLVDAIRQRIPSFPSPVNLEPARETTYRFDRSKFSWTISYFGIPHTRQWILPKTTILQSVSRLTRFSNHDFRYSLEFFDQRRRIFRWPMLTHGDAHWIAAELKRLQPSILIKSFRIYPSDPAFECIVTLANNQHGVAIE